MFAKKRPVHHRPMLSDIQIINFIHFVCQEVDDEGERGLLGHERLFKLSINARCTGWIEAGDK